MDNLSKIKNLKVTLKHLTNELTLKQIVSLYNDTIDIFEDAMEDKRNSLIEKYELFLRENKENIIPTNIDLSIFIFFVEECLGLKKIKQVTTPYFVVDKNYHSELKERNRVIIPKIETLDTYKFKNLGEVIDFICDLKDDEHIYIYQLLRFDDDYALRGKLYKEDKITHMSYDLEKEILKNSIGFDEFGELDVRTFISLIRENFGLDRIIHTNHTRVVVNKQNPLDNSRPWYPENVVLFCEIRNFTNFAKVIRFVCDLKENEFIYIGKIRKNSSGYNLGYAIYEQI